MAGIILLLCISQIVFDFEWRDDKDESSRPGASQKFPVAQNRIFRAGERQFDLWAHVPTCWRHSGSPNRHSIWYTVSQLQVCTIINNFLNHGLQQIERLDDPWALHSDPAFGPYHAGPLKKQETDRPAPLLFQILWAMTTYFPSDCPISDHAPWKNRRHNDYNQLDRAKTRVLCRPGSRC